VEDIVAGGYQVAHLVPQGCAWIGEVCDRYWESDIGVLDAAVFTPVERLDELKLATLHRRHFGVLRPRHADAGEIIPDEISSRRLHEHTSTIPRYPEPRPRGDSAPGQTPAARAPRR
jgi:hypothetical protein